MRAVAVILFIAVWIYGIILASLADQSKMPGGLRKGLWLAFTIIVPGIGSAIFAVSYLLANDPTRPTGRGAPRPGPIAPDDDPEFLARLDDELRRQHYERELRKHEDDDDEEN